MTTGPMASMPFHAAGIYGDEEQKTTDVFFASTYRTKLEALEHTRERNAAGHGACFSHVLDAKHHVLLSAGLICNPLAL
jgi:hypothetical protein